jgi:hypothetical protein
MKAGEEIARDLLARHTQLLHDLSLEKPDVDRVLEIIRHHDDPKVPVLDYAIERRVEGKIEDDEKKGLDENAIGKAERQVREFWARQGVTSGEFLRASKRYLFRPENLLLQWHHEADALWMITEDGIDADLARFTKDNRPTAMDTLKFNSGLHESEAAVYLAALGQSEAARYKFHDGTLYYSDTGYGIFLEARERLKGKFAK